MTTPARSRSPFLRTAIDKYALYTLCAQNPSRDAGLLRAIYADHAGYNRVDLILGEDFCAAAALSSAWCGLLPEGRAVGVDHDPEPLKRAHRHPRLKLIRADVTKVRDNADVIAALNFSIGELHQRAALVNYLRHVRSRLAPRGCFVCDIYGGSDAFLTGTVRQRFALPGERVKRVDYAWEQRLADPLSGRVTCAMHFGLRTPRGLRRMNDAFVYDWRLWSVPELRDAMYEAGLTNVQVYPRTPDAVDDAGDLYAAPIMDAHEVGDSFNVFVVGRR